MSIEAMKMALETLEANRQTHHYCEDTWYSCPKHEEGCANELEGDECICGADKANFQFDYAILALRKAIKEAEKQEPVQPAKQSCNHEWVPVTQTSHDARRWPLGEHEITKILDCERMKWSKSPPTYEFDLAFARAIEAAHGIGDKT